MTTENIRDIVLQHMKGAMTLQVAYIGIANDLFNAFRDRGKLDASSLGRICSLDHGYVVRWCDAAYAFGLLDKQEERFFLTELGKAFIPDLPGSCMPMAAASVLSGHMAERAATFMKTGEQPGEQVLWERESIAGIFGPMLENMFGGIFSREIFPAVPEFKELEQKQGTVVDLGCGNGWFLHTLVAGLSNVRCIGLDGFEDNIAQAQTRAIKQYTSDELSFRVGDISHFTVDEPVDMITMNRALHHVWSEKEKVFNLFRDHVKPGGTVVIWEPNWTGKTEDLRQPGKAPLAFQNLAEHVQGNYFMRPEEIVAEFLKIGMEVRVQLFGNGNEAVIVAKRL